MRRLAPWYGVHAPILRNGRVGHNQWPGIPRISVKIEKLAKPHVTVLKTAQCLTDRSHLSSFAERDLGAFATPQKRSNPMHLRLRHFRKAKNQWLHNPIDESSLLSSACSPS
jgi:hypothetical protein